MRQNLRRHDRGFTMVELMIVVALIGIISSLAIPNYLKFTARSQRAEMLETVSKMKLYFKTTIDNTGSFITPNTPTAGTQSAVNPNPATPVGQPASWDNHRAGWVDLPFPPEGALRMRYAYTPADDHVTIDVCGSFPGMGANIAGICGDSLLGNYRYVEIFYPNGTSDITEFPVAF
ncbi:MAG: prepilin-type N-terminal cleavage/methylation domain-containing protein [Deltaproteobacteria bacterium]|nr:MAG: prepilin-type N-terminal cleavage/methylation domain-containing protein [Deltaproteobacteria bacterium]